MIRLNTCSKTALRTLNRLASGNSVCQPAYACVGAALPAASVNLPAGLAAGSRSLHISSPAFKKHEKGKKHDKSAAAAAADPADAAATELDVQGAETKLKASLDAFNVKIKELRHTETAAEKFNKLEITLSHGNVCLLKDIATVQARGNKINIVAYDPTSIKQIRTAIISQLNLPAEPSAEDEQLLSVTVPSDSEAKKSALQAELKSLHDHFLSSPSRHAISNIRRDALAPLRKVQLTKMSNDQQKQYHAIEKLAKTYTQKLNDAFKAVKF